MTNYDHIVLCLPFTWSCIGGAVGRFLPVQGSSALFPGACLTACLPFTLPCFEFPCIYTGIVLCRRMPLQLSLELRLFFSYGFMCSLYIHCKCTCLCMHVLCHDHTCMYTFIQEMREQLDIVLQQKVSRPRMDLYTPLSATPPASSQLIQSIIDLIASEDYQWQVFKISL